MKILMIDPWGVNNTELYLKGICGGISKFLNLTLITNYFFKDSGEENYNIKKLFFKISENMKENKLRKILRGIEYFITYLKILKEVENYDIIHIQWMLSYNIDIYFLKKMKKRKRKIIYTAHNIFPHIKGGKHIKKLKIIYGLVDIIILHGEEIRSEFKKYFPEYIDKIRIQRHGFNFEDSFENYDITVISNQVKQKIDNYKNIYIFFGNMFFNKGVDRLVNIWLDNFFGNDESLLILAGRKAEGYKELDSLEEKIYKTENILYFNKFIEDNLLNYLIKKSDLILLPYRHASMSGVIFTAAQFKKPVLSTDTGSIKEYLNLKNSIISKNEDKDFFEKLKYINEVLSKDELKKLGNILYENLKKDYSWNKIGYDLVEKIYFEKNLNSN